MITGLAVQIGDLRFRIAAPEKALLARHRANELSQYLGVIPGIGVISKTALVRPMAAILRGGYYLLVMGL